MKTGERARILLVEDNEVDVEAMRRALARQSGVEAPTVARDGKEALEILRGTTGGEIHAGPWVVVLDLNMPRMDGHEFLAELRADPSLERTIVFVLTTSQAGEDVAASYERGVAGYLVKSDQPQRYLEQVSMLADFTRLVTFAS